MMLSPDGTVLIRWRDAVGHVELPDSVTSIDWQAFLECETITSIRGQNVLRIKGMAFSMCSNLTSIDFPKVVDIHGEAFYRCYKLIALKCHVLQAVNRNAFSYCKKLTEIDCPLLKFVAKCAFSDCPLLTWVALPQIEYLDSHAFNNSGVQQIYLSRTLIGISQYDGCYYAVKTNELLDVDDDSGYEDESDEDESDVDIPITSAPIITAMPAVNTVPIVIDHSWQCAALVYIWVEDLPGEVDRIKAQLPARLTPKVRPLSQRPHFVYHASPFSAVRYRQIEGLPWEPYYVDYRLMAAASFGLCVDDALMVAANFDNTDPPPEAQQAFVKEWWEKHPRFDGYTIKPPSLVCSKPWPQSNTPLAPSSVQSKPLALRIQVPPKNRIIKFGAAPPAVAMGCSELWPAVGGAGGPAPEFPVAAAAGFAMPAPDEAWPPVAGASGVAEEPSNKKYKPGDS